MIGTWIATAFATAIGFLALDSTWLSLAASRLYRPRLGSLLLERFNAAPAGVFYLIYLVGILVFAVAPALATGRSTTALLRGAMLGLVAYSTYDLTNQATLRGWSTTVTIADLCWGSFVTATAATIGFTVARWMLARG
jgi:uncharacterized membrane protein